MAAVRITKDVPIKTTLATTLRRLDPGDDVRTIWLTAVVDVYLVFDNSKAEGDALPAAYFRIPANVAWPIDYTGVRPLIAGASAGDATLIGKSR